MDETRPAGFWIRAVAAAVDFAIFFLVQVSYGYLARRLWGITREDAWALAPMLWIFTLLFALAYTTVLHALGGQTIGKMLVGARVVMDDGEPPPLGTALLRYFAYYLSLGTFTFGYWMAALRRDKRALHDLIAGTRVERTRQAPRPRPSAADPAPPVLSPPAPGWPIG
jgi:uncharacterized RDD family membrane protein YckC